MNSMPGRIDAAIRFVFFCVFFTIGAGTITFSILIEPEVSTYFRNRQTLAKIEAENERIVDLTHKYQTQIDLINREPNLLRRLELVTFGRALRSPKADSGNSPILDKTIQETAQTVLSEMAYKPEEPPLPFWLERCIQPNIRTSLFLAGCGLVILTFLFFGSPAPQDPSSKSLYKT